MKRARRAPAAAPRRRLGRRGAGWIAILVGVGVALGFFGRRAAPPPPPTAPPPIVGTIEEIYKRGRELLDAKRAAEALPLLLRAVRARPELWQTHQSYAVALLNTSYDSRLHQGFPAPVTRSSLERVAAATEAIAELERAQTLAPAAREQARARRLRAQLMGAWGFPWDSFILYRQAQGQDPTWQEPGVLGDQMMMLMRDLPRARPPARAAAAP